MSHNNRLYTGRTNHCRQPHQPIEADIRNYHKANFRERNGRACYSFRAARRNARRGI